MNLKSLINGMALVILSMVLVFIDYSIAGNLDLDSPYGVGRYTGGVAVCLLLPLIFAAIPAGIYWVWKRKRMPRLNVVIWFLWGLLSFLPAFLRIANGVAG